MGMWYGIKSQAFENHLGQVIEPNSKIYAVTSTKGVTVREGSYLGMHTAGPYISVSYKDGQYEVVKTFVLKSGRIYRNN